MKSITLTALLGFAALASTAALPSRDQEDSHHMDSFTMSPADASPSAILTKTLSRRDPCCNPHSLSYPCMEGFDGKMHEIKCVDGTAVYQAPVTTPSRITVIDQIPCGGAPDREACLKALRKLDAKHGGKHQGKRDEPSASAHTPSPTLPSEPSGILYRLWKSEHPGQAEPTGILHQAWKDSQDPVSPSASASVSEIAAEPTARVFNAAQHRWEDGSGTPLVPAEPSKVAIVVAHWSADCKTAVTPNGEVWTQTSGPHPWMNGDIPHPGNGQADAGREEETGHPSMSEDGEHVLLANGKVSGVY